MAGTTVRRQRYARRGARPPARLHLGVGQRSGIRAGSRPSSGKLARSRLTGSFIPPRTAARVAYGSPAQPVPLQGGEIGCPQGIAVLADLAQVAPGVDAGIVQVVEYDPDGVVALRDQFHDPDMAAPRSEEHTSELQSLMRISYAVFRLQKKKRNQLQCGIAQKITGRVRNIAQILRQDNRTIHNQ